MRFAKGLCHMLSLVGENDGVRAAGMLVEKWDAEDLDACGHVVGWLVGRLLGWLKEDAMRSDKVEEGRWKKVVESLMVRSLRKYLVIWGRALLPTGAANDHAAGTRGVGPAANLHGVGRRG